MPNSFTLPPDPSRVMEGLRDTGYSFNTAIADLVDNSIAANATKVQISIKQSLDNKPLLFIADNGCGMNITDLCNAMKYGSKKRQDAASLGKFGLGLKTASTAFCRRLSLISRGSDKEVNKICWDLDHISAVNDWVLLREIPSEEELELLEEVAQG